MSEDTLEILLRIGNRYYEGKLHPQKIGTHPPDSKPPMIPEPYGEMVTVTDQGDHWEVKPRQFLGTSNFTEIASIVRKYGGEYVSAGKSSHFRIPK